MFKQKILVADSNIQHLKTIKKALTVHPFFVIVTADNGSDCFKEMAKHDTSLLILNHDLPPYQGITLLNKLKKEKFFVPVIMTLNRYDEGIIMDVLNSGAFSCLAKGKDGKWLEILYLMVKRCLNNHYTACKKKELEKRLQDEFISTISTLAALIEIKDPYTGGHSRTVRNLSLAIGRKLKLPAAELEQIEIAAFLHDIGKIGIPGRILNKPGSLSEQEYSHIQKHVELGSLALVHVKKMQMVSDIIKHHHEAYNGRGYPDGLKGYNIPIGARIIHIADAYSAMTSNRPYRPAMPETEAIAELQKNKGVEFDPAIVDIFLEMLFQSLQQNAPGDTPAENCLRLYLA